VPSKEERDTRLDELADSTRKWAEEQRERLEEQVALGERILKGREGSERLAGAAVQSVSSLVVDEINDFLTG
jgi:hypothetical protein